MKTTIKEKAKIRIYRRHFQRLKEKYPGDSDEELHLRVARDYIDCLEHHNPPKDGLTIEQVEKPLKPTSRNTIGKWLNKEYGKGFYKRHKAALKTKPNK